MSLDSSEFDRSFRKIVKKALPAAAKRGLKKAGLQFMRDCVFYEPTVPLKEGPLRGSGSVHVQDKLVGTSPNPTGLGTPCTTIDELPPKDELWATIGWNKPYATRLHENPQFQFTEPGSGGKFAEKTLSERRDTYIAIIANEIKKG